MAFRLGGQDDARREGPRPSPAANSASESTSSAQPITWRSGRSGVQPTTASRVRCSCSSMPASSSARRRSASSAAGPSAYPLPIVGRPALRQQPGDVQWPRPDLELAVRPSRPFAARAVGVQLDAVVVGIAEVDRFADPVIRGAVERNSRCKHPTYCVSERRPVGIEHRDVEEARRPRLGRRAAADSHVLRPMWWWYPPAETNAAWSPIRSMSSSPSTPDQKPSARSRSATLR